MPHRVQSSRFVLPPFTACWPTKVPTLRYTIRSPEATAAQVFTLIRAFPCRRKKNVTIKLNSSDAARCTLFCYVHKQVPLIDAGISSQLLPFDAWQRSAQSPTRQPHHQKPITVAAKTRLETNFTFVNTVGIQHCNAYRFPAALILVAQEERR